MPGLYLTLRRFSYSREATLGMLSAPGLALPLATLEEPWRADPDGPGGQRREDFSVESCIGDGMYRLLPHSGAKFSGVWVLVNEALGVYQAAEHIPLGQKWGRGTILIHNGNTLANTLGCILIGRRHGRLNGETAVLDSVAALGDLRLLLGNTERHQIEIRPTHGTAEAVL